MKTILLALTIILSFTACETKRQSETITMSCYYAKGDMSMFVTIKNDRLETSKGQIATTRKPMSDTFYGAGSRYEIMDKYKQQYIILCHYFDGYFRNYHCTEI